MIAGLDAVRDATRALHTQAERGGIIASILAGRATRFGVALLLRNLLPIYQIIDASPLGVAALARTTAIEADLRVLSPDQKPALLPEGAAYAQQIARAAQGDGAALIAHAYVRYLGDLNGGLLMQRRLAVCLGDVAGELTFNAYPMLNDKKTFAQAYRNELDRVVRGAELTSVIQEAKVAFEMNIALSEAVGLQDRGEHA